ncbi:MAG: MOSC domain-containing protein [Rhodobacteraceae bacterium]|nr:MOSC domain-containing protein [Paracoccaceae bacterium]
MPALIPTDFTGTVTFLGHVPDRAAGLASQPQQDMQLTFSGHDDEAHAGLTRPSCSRVLSLYPRDTEIRNTRQLCVMSAEEIAAIAKNMGLETLDPTWMAASIVITGIPDFTLIPPSSRLQFASGATITVDMENQPCVLPGPVIEKTHPGYGKLFKPAAKARRGVTAWVEREGLVSLGDTVRLHIPGQPRWPNQR